MLSLSLQKLPVVAVIMIMLAVGCQSEDEDEASALAQSATAESSIDASIADVAQAGSASDAGSPRDAGAPRPTEPPVLIRSPNAPFITSIKANGNGCPPGTWTVALAPDDESYAFTFSAYSAEVEDGRRTSFKDCNLTVALRSSTGVRYAVTAFDYAGNASIETNVRGFVTARHYSAGSPVSSVDRESRVDLTGPADRPFSWVSNVDPMDLVWTPCGLDRNVQVVTRVGLQKSTNKGAGFSQLSGLKLRLAWRTCGP